MGKSQKSLNRFEATLNYIFCLDIMNASAVLLIFLKALFTLTFR